MFDSFMAKAREERLSNSSQLMLWELKMKLQMVEDKTKPIVFDFGMKPAWASSWRGSYCELWLEYSEKGGGNASWNSDRISYESSYWNSYESDTFDIPESPTAQNFLDMLEALTDKEMTGYRGGENKMHKNVAVYLGNYGESGVSWYNWEDYSTVAVYDIMEENDRVVIITNSTEY